MSNSLCLGKIQVTQFSTMNNFKSLSDSSTSESEEDGKRIQQHSLSYEARTIKKRGFSTDDTEDEHSDVFQSPKKAKTEFKNPSKYVERELSDSESDDKQVSMKGSTFQANFNMPTADSLSNYGVGMKLMEKMGYKTGTGLGKYEQGRVDIVHASKQRGRRGLGLQLQGLEPSDIKWDSAKEEITIQEPIEWIPECKAEPLTISALRQWVLEGEKKIDISEETEFCDPGVLKNVIAFKSVFDKLGGEEMRNARTRSNPFETIRGGIFLNRAAMKMANMDAMFEFMFTNPKKPNGELAVAGNKLLYFADVCAGPGGFSEYVLWKKKWSCKGFGFTLKIAHDFKLEDFFAGSPETFEPYYGVNGDGDVYAPENLRDFRKFVLANTESKGVHFVMADGGFSVEGQENEQEILSKRLYLCQFLCALFILRIGGHFVCKLFDLFTPFSVGLVYLMYHAFEKVCIFKPNTSRPANSERYIICKWLKEDTKDICDYMFEVNCILEKYSSSGCNQDVVEIVPLDVLKSDDEFYEYIFNSNNSLGTRQIIHLDKIRVFASNVNLHEDRQSDLKKQCLAFWQVPDKARSAPSRPDPKDKFKELLKGESFTTLQKSPTQLNESTLSKLKSVFEFSCVVCGETDMDKATLFLGLGRSNIYKLDIKANKWNKIDATLELPADTLFFGELVSELKGEGRAQRKITCLHIIDAFSLGGEDIRKKHYSVRMQLAEKLAKAVSKPSKPDYTPLRVKTVFELKNVEEVFDNLALRNVKNCQIPRLCFDLRDGRHILPTGLLIFKTTKEPWVMAYSKSHQIPYVFDTKRNKSSYEMIDEACADFITSLSNRILWHWGPEVQLIPDQDYHEPKKPVIHSQVLISFVQKHLNHIMGVRS